MFHYPLTCHAAHSVFCVAQVLTLVSRAHHDANEHDAAKRALLRGLHMFPTDFKLRFNLAFVLQVCAARGSDVNTRHLPSLQNRKTAAGCTVSLRITRCHMSAGYISMLHVQVAAFKPVSIACCLPACCTSACHDSTQQPSAHVPAEAPNSFVLNVCGWCVQEQAIKLFKREYPVGDQQKLDDCTTAMQALQQVRQMPSTIWVQHRKLCCALCPGSSCLKCSV